MRRTTLALSILGLALALAHFAVAQTTAKVLWQPDLTKGNPLVGAGTIYREAVSSSGDQTGLTTPATGTNTQVAPFLVITDPSASRFQWLDGGDSTNTGGDNSQDDTLPLDAGGVAPWLLLTGDPTWADVSITSKIVMWNQNTGHVMLVARAAPKTKASDPNSYYALSLTTDNSALLASQVRDGLIRPNDTSTDDNGTTRGCTLRLLKRVNGKWTQLAEANQDRLSSVPIPRINNLGHDHDVNHGQGSPTTDALVGGYLRFVVKGTTLTGFVSIDGTTFAKAIETTDTATDALKTGLVGLLSVEIEPCFKDILVTEAL